MKKDEMREFILKKIKAQSTNLALKKSVKIRQKLLDSEDYKKANSIFTYVSKKEEVDTHNIIKDAIKNRKKVYGPILHNKQIFAGEVKSFDRLTKGDFGILQPFVTSNKNKFDIIIVPGLAFDSSGARIGRGGGYFDKFLPLTKGKKIALAFDFQIIPKIDVEKHDIFMDKIITEKRTISRNTHF
ncbi:MAG: 5-formyltetrahydrofolate cyclo-ligase [Candidatus Aenigmatarchaeota archaeon]